MTRRDDDYFSHFYRIFFNHKNVRKKSKKKISNFHANLKFWGNLENGFVINSIIFGVLYFYHKKMTRVRRGSLL